MQHARLCHYGPIVQMRGLQRGPPFGGERARPVQARAGLAPARAQCALTLPPGTAALGSGGFATMAQAFFAASGNTPRTGFSPACSGGR
ncbi:hypothetical protein HNQ50_001689 [Silvimonas terrae]|uniref:Uncharacterized protein n=1 Tax=Silvimonas terrae TaxID=300266 RepID=A0A840REZ1_9NEIS|nr:hypothetical protein [Silvimonas terrae]